MAVSYKKLFKLLIDRDMKKKDFKELTGISQGTLNKLQNGGNVMVDVLEKICLNMDCNVDDIMEICYSSDPDRNQREELSLKI